MLSSTSQRLAKPVNLMKLVYDMNDADDDADDAARSDSDDSDGELFTSAHASRAKHRALNAVESSRAIVSDISITEQDWALLKEELAKKFVPRDYFADEKYNVDALDDTALYGDFEDLEKDESSDDGKAKSKGRSKATDDADEEMADANEMGGDDDEDSEAIKKAKEAKKRAFDAEYDSKKAPKDEEGDDKPDEEVPLISYISFNSPSNPFSILFQA